MISKKKYTLNVQSLIIFALTNFLFFALTSNVLAEICDIKGNDFSKAALSKGFRNSINISGGGSCIFFTPKHPEKVVGVAGNSKDLVCSIQYFGSKKLSKSWKIMGATVTGHSFEFQGNTPRSGTNNPEILFAFGIKKGSEKILTIQQVKLSGPKCSQWREALQ